MKSKQVLLLKLLLLNQFKINELKDKKSKYRKNSIFIGTAIGIVVVMLAGYSYGIGYGLGSIGLASVIPVYAITIVSLVTLFFTVFKSNGILFGFKDYEIQTSLPIKTSAIISSRFIYMYLMNTLFAAIVMIPLGIAFYQYEHPSILFFLEWVCGIFLSTLIPTTIAAVIGAIIVYIASHFKYTNAFTTVISLSFVVALLVLPIFFGSTGQQTLDVKQISQMGEVISKQNKAIYPISSLFEKAVLKNDIGALVLFAALSIGWYLLFLFLLATKYKMINTAILTHSARSNYKMQELTTSGVLVALYKKELKRFFSSNVYVLNVGMGAIMALLMAIAVFVLKPSKLNEIMEISNLDEILIKIIAFAFSAVLAMSCTTAVSLSLEGKNLWILKSLPVKTRTIMNSKILVNLTITLPVAIVFGILMNIKFHTDFITRIMFFITPIVYSFFVALWGMFINIKLPNFEWESETALIKQGMASMIGMLGGTLIGIIPVAVILFLDSIAFQLVQVVMTVVFGMICGFLYKGIGKYKF